MTISVTAPAATSIPAVRIPTGYPALDALLGGGWPAGILTELLVSGQSADQGSGELGLLSPALAWLTGDTRPATNRPVTNKLATNKLATNRWVMLIAPPWIPYAPGLSWQGLTLSRVLMVRVRQPLEALWVMEETLRSGACAGVVAWCGMTALQRTGRGPRQMQVLQRLHLLAGRQSAWAVLIRAARFRRERSPARLRLELLSTAPATLQIEIFRNGWRGAGTVTVERRT